MEGDMESGVKNYVVSDVENHVDNDVRLVLSPINNTLVHSALDRINLVVY